ncbi:hypothetical protein SY88_18925 [Clostridiales bacterium PH28_bin88]|nr:hypothetical protein SY88_18925 [Clostridiales bacterium PH28_bin88]
MVHPNIRLAAGILFSVYGLLLVKVLFLGPYRFGPGRYNLAPFNSLVYYIKSYNDMNIDTWFLNLFGNVIMFMPLGFLLPLLLTKMAKWRQILYASILTSSILEILQFGLGKGSLDVDDILLNTVGGVIGYSIFLMGAKIYTTCTAATGGSS